MGKELLSQMPVLGTAQPQLVNPVYFNIFDVQLVSFLLEFALSVLLFKMDCLTQNLYINSDYKYFQFILNTAFFIYTFTSTTRKLDGASKFNL